jgi:hypothetical protein
MARLAWSLAGAILLVGDVGHASWVTAQALHEWCGSDPAAAQAYVLGVLDYNVGLRAARKLGSDDEAVCPWGAPPPQLAETVCEHLLGADPTARWTTQGAPAVMAALVSRYPCR